MPHEPPAPQRDYTTSLGESAVAADESPPLREEVVAATGASQAAAELSALPREAVAEAVADDKAGMPNNRSARAPGMKFFTKTLAAVLEGAMRGVGHDTRRRDNLVC